jgi:hypothetical protein
MIKNLFLCILIVALLAVPAFGEYVPSPLQPLKDAPAPEIYDFTTVFSYTGEPVKIVNLYTECVGPLDPEATFAVTMHQWENRQQVWTGIETLEPFFFTPTRVGHFYLKAHVVGDPTLTFDSRLGEGNCPEVCLCPGVLRPWMIFAWPAAVVGEGTIE